MSFLCLFKGLREHFGGRRLALSFITLCLATSGCTSCPLKCHNQSSKAEGITSTICREKPPLELSTELKLAQNNTVVIPSHPQVQKYLHHYNSKGKASLRSALKRSRPYHAKMKAILKEHDLPEELLCVALVESRFYSKARSPKGAAGYWQLMPRTARRFGLKVAKGRDERLDPIKSTKAAARYLRHLYRELQSWPLVLAAYNAGSSKVARAIARHGKSDFWELANCRAFTKQTTAFVSKVHAAIATVNSHRDLLEPTPTKTLELAALASTKF